MRSWIVASNGTGSTVGYTDAPPLEKLPEFFYLAPKGFDYAVEIRNPNYLRKTFFDFLRDKDISPVPKESAMKTNYLGAEVHCKMTEPAVERNGKIVVWETKDNWPGIRQGPKRSLLLGVIRARAPRPHSCRRQGVLGGGAHRAWWAGWAGPKDLTAEKAS